MIGHIGLWATSVVLVFETVVLFLVSPKKVEWLRRNWWLIGLTILVIVGVIFSVGPMQILGLLRSVGALRVLRAKQVAKAGHSLQKTSSSSMWQHLGTLCATLVVSACGAGLLLFAVTYLLVRQSRSRQRDEHDDEQ